MVIPEGSEDTEKNNLELQGFRGHRKKIYNNNNNSKFNGKIAALKQKTHELFDDRNLLRIDTFDLEMNRKSTVQQAIFRQHNDNSQN